MHSGDRDGLFGLKVESFYGMIRSSSRAGVAHLNAQLLIGTRFGVW